MKIPLKIILKTMWRYSQEVFVIFYYKILSLFYKEKSKFKDAWLVCERGIEARDNGFTFFKYVRENYPQKRIYYLIDSSHKKDYEKVKKLGDTIEYNSFEHKMALFFASHLISTHIGFISKWSLVLFKKIFAPRNQIFVLLNHGITKEDMSLMLNKLTTGVDLFIAATKNDWETVALDKRYGYDKKDVALTGYARYDNWHSFLTKRQILFMPTWRKYLVKRNIYDKNNPNVTNDFTQSAYFQHLSNFLNNKELHGLLEEHNLDLLFYPHYEVQKSLPLFKIENSRIKIACRSTHDIPTLLKESLMLISDYSGVTFDFAYMKKPLIYYQFDQQEYYSGHYLKGDFEMENDGLGVVVTCEKDLINEIKHYIMNGFEMEEKYTKRVDSTFTFHDNKNCERIYNAIINYKL